MNFLPNWFSKRKQEVASTSAGIFDKTIDRELEQIVDKYSASSMNDNTPEGVDPSIYNDTSIQGLVGTMPIQTNKITRLRQYNVMSKYTELSWAIEEIAMDFFHYDDQKRFINLNINPNYTLNKQRQKVLNEEFDKFIGLFNFSANGFTTIKNYIIEGESCWENVIDVEHPEKGIQAVKYIPNRYFDFLKNQNNGTLEGIYFDMASVKQDIFLGLVSQSYAGAATVFNAMVTLPGYTYAMGDNNNLVKMLWPQITYFNSGTFNYENSIVFPLIEGASVPYQQLSLLQDAAIILRITRAPERLVFNIDTGGLPEKRSKSMVQTFINAFKSKKVSNNRGEVRQAYDPASMLEAYFFWKQGESGGSNVTNLSSTVSYAEMQDIEYFQRRIFKTFKIPYARYKEDNAGTVQRKDQITYEEYSFTKFIIRQQLAFADALRKTFVTHLKLRKIWEQYDLKETDIFVEFVKPSLYDIYQAQELSTLKIGIYKAAVDDGKTFSKTMAMKKYLGWSDDDIKSNSEFLRKEQIFDAITEYYTDKAKKEGPVNVDPTIDIKGIIAIPEKKEKTKELEEVPAEQTEIPQIEENPIEILNFRDMVSKLEPIQKLDFSKMVDRGIQNNNIPILNFTDIVTQDEQANGDEPWKQYSVSDAPEASEWFDKTDYSQGELQPFKSLKTKQETEESPIKIKRVKFSDSLAE